MENTEPRNGAVLGRRLARELTNEELQEVSGGAYTDFNKDYGVGSKPGWDNTSTGPFKDADYSSDAG